MSFHGYLALASTVVSSLDGDTKIALLTGKDFWTTMPLPDHDVPSFVMADGPHGLRHQGRGSDHVGLGESLPATCFPTASALGATWDRELVERVGAAIGAEAACQGVDVVLGPGLNIKRHPACGRNFEYFSEDPLVSGVLAAAMVRGIQSEGVGACLKHYVANNQESDRFRLDTIVDERTLREIYLSSFETALRLSDPWMVMSSYNKLNGTHVGESEEMIHDILRSEFGFLGVVVSDWLAVSDRVEGVRAGLDLEMPSSGSTWHREISKALTSGVLPHRTLDLACTRVVALALRAADARAGRATAVDLDAHHSLAREAACAGAVLLTNDGVLPLDATAPGKVAVIGAFAKHPRFQGAGSSQVNPTRVTTLLEALHRKGLDVDYAAGYDPHTGDTTEQLLAEATRAAAEADVVVLHVGLPPTAESEGVDRAHLRLPDGHSKLIAQVIAANPRTVVALTAGAPVETPWADDAAAVLLTYLGGQASGEALADMLFGDAEPAGRLAESFPEVVFDLPADAHFADHATQVEYREGLYVGYRFHDTFALPARFPFGHGLGYASFDFGAPHVSPAGRGHSVSVEVTNTSGRAGSTVVQVYVRDVKSTLYRPDQELKGFARVHLEARQTRTVTIDLDERALAAYDARAGAWVVEEGEFEIRVGASSADIRECATLTVQSTATVSPGAAFSGSIASRAEFEDMLGHLIPTPAATLPYTRETLISDLHQTALGRLLRRILLRLISAKMGTSADGANAVTETAFAESTPLRAVAMASGGRVSLRVVDAVVRLLNFGSRRTRALGR
ncbi:glycoside hydrolase family 3 C-terminal domain-containing protein [Demequina sp.]|uniref:beta-glucosidase family protein n=1 Tax=Demequina sp. TaxID=2050685 RepID=UPI0025C6E896|nr:glycoside hydrolase family 3 C-terminal domain-containing protein [Demequina sp.]